MNNISIPLWRSVWALVTIVLVGFAGAGLYAAEGGPIPDEALAKLKQGNERFVSGEVTKRDFVQERKEGKLGQAPFACILACADSRVAPEQIFNAGMGELFVCRVAGNVADSGNIASMEFAVAVLGSPLIVAIGHTDCGAVAAAIDVVKNKTKLPGSLPLLISQIKPAVEKAEGQKGELLPNAINDNARLAAEDMIRKSAILEKAVEDGKLKVVPAFYDFRTGKVTFLD